MRLFKNDTYCSKTFSLTFLKASPFLFFFGSCSSRNFSMSLLNMFIRRVWHPLTYSIGKMPDLWLSMPSRIAKPASASLAAYSSYKRIKRYLHWWWAAKMLLLKYSCVDTIECNWWNRFCNIWSDHLNGSTMFSVHKIKPMAHELFAHGLLNKWQWKSCVMPVMSDLNLLREQSNWKITISISGLSDDELSSVSKHKSWQKI